MINTLRKTLEAQEKTQDIKQSPSKKIGTNPYARSRRNELTVLTGWWIGRWTSDQMLRLDAEQVTRQTGNRTLVATDQMLESSVRSSTVRFQNSETATESIRWQVTGRWPASDQCIAGSTVGSTGRVRSGRFSVRSVAESRDFVPNGYFLSGAYKYIPQPAI